MNAKSRMYLATVLWLLASVMTAEAEIVYTSVNMPVVIGDSYGMDLNHDGIIDFTLRSHLLEDYCQSGDGYTWNLSVRPGSGNAVMTEDGHLGSSYASALHIQMPVNSSGNFFTGVAVMAQLAWGLCGTGTLGEWLNVPDRYLGVQFRDAADHSHYGWVKMSTVAYVDQWNVIHASTVISGFAYEAIAGRGVLAGQMS